MAAWDRNTGSGDSIVAVIDSGLFTSEDTYAVHNDFIHAGGHNIWINPGEDLDGDGVLHDSDDLNGIDDDGNGLVDDLAGWDFFNDDPIAEDLAGHGTEVSGLIGAAGDNGYGITGASWQVALLSLKAGDFEYPWSVLAHCLDYARSLREAGHPVLITNHSYGDTLFAPEPLYEKALERARDAGLLVVAAAGNGGSDLDNSAGRFLPTEAALENVLSMAATDQQDRLAASSNFGEFSVDLAAPGGRFLSSAELGDAGEWTVETPAFLEVGPIPGRPEAEMIDAYFDLPEDRSVKFIRIDFSATSAD
jgi:subtilisin family serine protease